MLLFQIDSRLLIDWVGLVSLLGVGAMGVDKLLAVGRMSRISERTLWLLALFGGFPGVFVGGFVFHHKTSKVEFWGPVIVSAILWAVVFVVATPQAGHFGF